MSSVEQRIVELLGRADVRVLDHPAAGSAEDAARLRGTPLSIGAKSLVVKLYGRGFAVVAVPGDRKLDNAALRRETGARRLRFATRDELDALTGLSPGEIPPFGRPVFDLPLIVDAGFTRLDQVAFTPGRPDRSLVVGARDWLAAARPDAVLPVAV